MIFLTTKGGTKKTGTQGAMHHEGGVHNGSGHGILLGALGG
jgi:hypothetical protein